MNVSEGNDHDGNGRYGYGRDEHVCGKHDGDLDVRDENDHGVGAHLHAGDLHGNDLSDHVHRASAHAHGAHGRKRSCR